MGTRSKQINERKVYEKIYNIDIMMTF